MRRTSRRVAIGNTLMELSEGWVGWSPAAAQQPCNTLTHCNRCELKIVRKNKRSASTNSRRDARRQSIALAHRALEWAEEVSDAVRVVAHQLTALGKHDVAAPMLGQHATHLQHAPRTVKRVFDALVSHYSSV